MRAFSMRSNSSSSATSNLIEAAAPRFANPARPVYFQSSLNVVVALTTRSVQGLLSIDDAPAVTARV